MAFLGSSRVFCLLFVRRFIRDVELQVNWNCCVNKKNKIILAQIAGKERNVRFRDEVISEHYFL